MPLFLPILARAAADDSSRVPWPFVLVVVAFFVLSRLTNWVRNLQEQAKREQLKQQLRRTQASPTAATSSPAPRKQQKQRRAASRPATSQRPAAPPPLPAVARRPSVVTATASRPTPSIFPALLRDRATLRQQLVLGEILSKPLSLRDER